MLIDIVLASFNGQEFIEEQMQSILDQGYKDWRLLIHDDGSTDSTVSIVKDYADRFPGKIVLIEDGVTLGGAKENFDHLLKFTDSKYVMFCDQDDVWLPNKIEVTLSAMQKAEGQNPNKPIVVHSDLTVVDEHLRVISHSMFEGQRLKKQVNDFDDISMRNNVTGCTMMINSRLFQLSPRVPREAVMHDWWYACACLSLGGRIVFVDEPLILYRQHSNNTIGFKGAGILSYVKKILTPVRSIRSFFVAYKQAKSISPSFPLGKAIFVKLRSFF